MLLSCSWTLRSNICELDVESRGVATPEVFEQDANGGEELEPDERIGDTGEFTCGEVYLAKAFGGEEVIGDIEVNRGSWGAVALMGMVVRGSSSSSSDSGSGSSLGGMISFGGGLGLDLDLSTFFFFLPSPKKERLLLWLDDSFSISSLVADFS